MPYKDKNKQKEYQKQHYLQNKKAYLLSSKNRKNRNRKYSYKVKLQCSECKEDNQACLIFHHIDSTNKKFTISDGIRDAKKYDTFIEEINKCTILCSNCHRKHHGKKLNTGESWKNFSKSRVNKRLWYIQYMSDKKCSDCNESDKRCLDHHHIKDKKYTISYMLTSGHSLESLIEELNKCIILCSNCHRKKHHAL